MCCSFTSRCLSRHSRSTARPGPASVPNRVHSTSLSAHSIVSLQLLSHTCRSSILTTPTTPHPSTSSPVALPNTIMSTTGLGDARAELEVTISRLAGKRAIRARIDRLMHKRQSRQRFNLTDEQPSSCSEELASSPPLRALALCQLALRGMSIVLMASTLLETLC